MSCRKQPNIQHNYITWCLLLSFSGKYSSSLSSSDDDGDKVSNRMPLSPKVQNHKMLIIIQQLFHGHLSGATRVSRYEKKHSPTHTYPDHQPSFISFFHLLWSIASSLFNSRAWQSFFAQPLSRSSLVYLLVSLHFFMQSLSSYCFTYPYHHNLFWIQTQSLVKY